MPGIIPACAGSTLTGSVIHVAHRDHPRMCGEHVVSTIKNARSKGSSPHVRGAPCAYYVVAWSVGIIPACAGSTPPPRGLRTMSRDHPRMCGEHEQFGEFVGVYLGSSPHVRGALSRFERFYKIIGIIPACAGSTVCSATPRYYVRDHPRMCGEHLFIIEVFDGY